MLSKFLSIVVLLGFILPPQTPKIPSIYPNTEYKLYLPLVIYTYPFVDFVTLGESNEIGYPGLKCIHGYVTDSTPIAVYSVIMAITVIIYPYCTEYFCPPPESETQYGKPTLDATLPDQKNPFSYCLEYTKGGYEFEEVKQASASYNPPNGKAIYPLTIKSWTKEGTLSETTVSGIVRNDSGLRLAEIRVVGIAGLCPAIEAHLGSIILDPDEETSFMFEQFYCVVYWPTPFLDLVEISAQGVAEP